MSGGSMNYLYSHIQDAEFDLSTPERIAFKEHLNLIAKACKDIEWVDSGDNSDGSETKSILDCINNLDNIVITKDNLTPEIRKVIVNLYSKSSEIVQGDIWYYIDNDYIEDAVQTIEALTRFWGDDPVFQEANALIDRLILLKEYIEE